MTAYRIKQNGVVVVKVEGPDDYAEREVMRYAMQYLGDGPLTVERLHGKRWRPNFSTEIKRPAARSPA